MKNLQSIFLGLRASDLKSIRPKLTGANPGHRFANRSFCPTHVLRKPVSVTLCQRCASTGRLYIHHRILENRWSIETKTA